MLQAENGLLWLDMDTLSFGFWLNKYSNDDFVGDDYDEDEDEDEDDDDDGDDDDDDDGDGDDNEKHLANSPLYQ